jgi:Domain of unknown function (DUF4383)
MATYTPARLYATVVGVVLVIAGIIGFFYNSSFTSNTHIHDDVFGILSVNGWHNVVHIATGLLGLALAGWAAREYALGIGVVYIAVAIWGFILGSGHSILSIVPINTADSVLHLALGVVGVAAGLATPRGAAAGPPRPAVSTP